MEQPEVPPISLFIGYFASQRTGQTMHSPQNCLPGAGWTFESQKYTTIQDINGKNYNVGEYVISNGDIGSSSSTGIRRTAAASPTNTSPRATWSPMPSASTAPTALWFASSPRSCHPSP